MIRRAVALGAGLLAVVPPALSQARNPFGVGISEGGGSATGLTGWLLAQQGWFEHQLSAGVRAAAQDAGAIWWLAGLGFVYGIFHAAGPGHGKAVLASYMVANERALRRGLVLSTLAALLQGTVAILLVGILAIALHATAQRMKDVASLVELASFAGVACLGAWLTWRKGRAALALWRELPREGRGTPETGFPSFSSLTPFAPEGGRRLAFAAHAPAARSRLVCVDADVSHPAGCACHAADPRLLGGARFSWREAGLTVLAAGARPCSGAILVLVFALVQKVFLAGVASVVAMSVGVAITTGALASVAVLAKTVARRLAGLGSRTGRLVVCGVELAAAVAVLAAGVVLLLGRGVMA